MAATVSPEPATGGVASELRSPVGPVLSSARWRRLATALVALGLISGCTDGGEAEETTRDAAIYRSVIVDVVDRSGVELDETEGLPVLFIESLSPDGIPLQVQVGVVGGLVEEYEIRFIDHLDEAVENDLPTVPVRAGSLLIGLGDIDIDGTAEVHSELYRQLDDVRGFSYTLTRIDDDRWDVVGSPLDVEPEGLVPKS